MNSPSSAPTWRNSEQLRWITALSVDKGDALEIGTFGGAGSRALLAGVSGLVFSIEPLGYSPENEEEMEVAAHQLTDHIEELAAEFPHRFIHIAGRSEHQVWARPIDVLMIDGDHSYQGVADSAARFATHINRGGVVFVDAYDHPNKPEVKPAWDAFMKTSPHTWQSLGSVRNLFAWRRTLRDGCPNMSAAGSPSELKDAAILLRSAHTAVSPPAHFFGAQPA